MALDFAGTYNSLDRNQHRSSSCNTSTVTNISRRAIALFDVSLPVQGSMTGIQDRKSHASYFATGNGANAEVYHLAIK